MKRAWVIAAVGVVVLVGAGWGYSRYAAGQAAARDAAATAAAGTPTSAQDTAIWASGKLVPVRWAGLSPASNGTVRAVHGVEGDRVVTGTVLVELDNAALQSQVDVASAALAEAQAARDRLVAGATQPELAAARADVATAQGGVAQAQAALRQAQTAVAAAQAQVTIVQAQYDELASRPTDAERVQAQQAVAVAQAAVRQAQRAYDEVKGDPKITSRPEALALEQATLTLQTAQAAYAVAAAGATPQQLAVARAQVAAAKAQVEVARGQAPAAEAGIQTADGELAAAQAALDKLEHGATAEDRAAAAARVQSAQAALAAARAQLAQTQVSAPFAGQVGTILVRLGEQAVAGQAVLMLGDTGRMHVETTDLRETDVPRLKLGMPVELTFDALPGRTFQGTVTRIAAMSTVEKGSTNYTVTVDAAELDPGLRWGMTAFVNIPAAP